MVPLALVVPMRIIEADAVVLEYVEAMERGDQFPPVEVRAAKLVPFDGRRLERVLRSNDTHVLMPDDEEWIDGWMLLDGHHRWRANHLLGREVIDVVKVDEANWRHRPR